MFWPKLVIAVVAISAFTACGPKPRKMAPVAKADPCPTKNDTSIAADRTLQKQTWDLHAIRQRVIRKECSGAVKSDKFEVSAPSKTITVTAAQALSGADTQSSGTNRTTCNTAKGAIFSGLALDFADKLKFGNLLGLNKQKPAATFRFTADTSPTWLNTHVRKNADNYIDYQFSTCVERSAEKNSCIRSQVVEKGTLVLSVVYTESTIDEVRTVEAAGCK